MSHSDEIDTDDCRHENVRTFRSIPPRSECRDCGATVERRWVRVNPPEDGPPGLLAMLDALRSGRIGHEHDTP